MAVLITHTKKNRDLKICFTLLNFLYVYVCARKIVLSFYSENFVTNLCFILTFCFCFILPSIFLLILSYVSACMCVWGGEQKMLLGRSQAEVACIVQKIECDFFRFLMLCCLVRLI